MLKLSKKKKTIFNIKKLLCNFQTTHLALYLYCPLDLKKQNKKLINPGPGSVLVAMPVISRLWEADAGESLEARNWRPTCTTQ